jgi:DNA-binding MarR family transcriptional regulator
VTEISPEVLRTASQLRAGIGPLVRRLRQLQNDGELTLSQASVLARLERSGPSTPGALAACEQIRPQSIAATVAALEQLGMVSRRGDPSDGRRVLVEATEAGRVWVHGLREQRAQRLARAIADSLSPVEQKQLAAAIPLLERIGQVV